MYDDLEDHAQSKTDKALISRISKALKSIRKKIEKNGYKI